MQKGVILKTLIHGGNVSLAVLDTTSVVEEAILRHALTPTAAAALGRTLTATAYLSSWLKNDDSSLSVTLSGGGAGGKICVSGDAALHMRGFIENGQVDLPPRADGKLNVGACVGKNGTLTVIRDDGDGLPFVGTCALVSGEIAEDFSAYFLNSEQRPTGVALGVRIGKDSHCLGAGGVFLQPLPGGGEEAVDFCEREISRFSALSSLIEEKGAEGVLRMLTAEPYDSRTVYYRCHCSRKKAEGLVMSLGYEDALAATKEEGGLKVSCHYCNTDYSFTKEDIDRLFREKK